MHYGHPDVFDRMFHVTRGGISKASRVINISEDIYAGNFYNFVTGHKVNTFFVPSRYGLFIFSVDLMQSV